MPLLLVGILIGAILGAGVTLLVWSSSTTQADAVMFKTLRTYDFNTGTRYVLTPEQPAEKPRPHFRVV